LFEWLARLFDCVALKQLRIQAFKHLLHTAREKHSLDALLVVAAHESRVVEVAFLSGLLLGQDVTVIGMLSLDFTSAGESEALLGTRFSL
jgi:hypothetical protein